MIINIFICFLGTYIEFIYLFLTLGSLGRLEFIFAYHYGRECNLVFLQGVSQLAHHLLTDWMGCLVSNIKSSFMLESVPLLNVCGMCCHPKQQTERDSVRENDTDLGIEYCSVDTRAIISCVHTQGGEEGQRFVKEKWRGLQHCSEIIIIACKGQ